MTNKMQFERFEKRWRDEVTGVVCPRRSTVEVLARRAVEIDSKIRIEGGISRATMPEILDVIEDWVMSHYAPPPLYPVGTAVLVARGCDDHATGRTMCVRWSRREAWHSYTVRLDTGHGLQLWEHQILRDCPRTRRNAGMPVAEKK